MTSPRTRLTTIMGAATALVGFAIAFLFFLQPWRSCAEDDSPTGCVALPQDTIGLVIALIVAVVGLLVLFLGRGDRVRTRRDGLRSE